MSAGGDLIRRVFGYRLSLTQVLLFSLPTAAVLAIVKLNEAF